MRIRFKKKLHFLSDYHIFDVRKSKSRSRMPDGRSVLIIFAHPSLHTSKINRTMIEAVRQLDGITVNDLYETYPDYYIDIKREQNLLIQSQLIVLHHPLYWYSSPAIIKEWQDVVLRYGFAYGSEGKALEGKDFMLAISTGGPEEAYRKGGYHGFGIDEFLKPFEQTAHLCRMNYLSPFVVHNGYQLQPIQIENHAYRYKKYLLDYISQLGSG